MNFCAAILEAISRDGVLLDVRRRGKPSTWLPRQKLAEERILDRGEVS